MILDDWHEVERVLIGALQLQGNDRQAYVESACGPDLARRKTVESLLALESEVEGFLETPAALHARPGADPRPTSLVAGEKLGPYRLQREIGHGGMSTVWLAERDDAQFQRAVAIKVIRRGMDSALLLERFHEERQILANFNHPHIAQLYDSGTTVDGLPYFVMEYVDGLQIDTFCDTHQLTIRQRLELFRQICSAVQYAHQSLVVHRDIKPSNILVTHDGQPKLLDFGIAKLLAPESRVHDLGSTVTWMRMMTPNYASPEQAQGGRITTSSDVYSLGVLLYELLTGRLPHRFETGLPQEIERVVSEQQPQRPSTLLAATEAARQQDLEQVSRHRGVAPGRLRSQLRGDLDNIALTALRAQPERRYSSVEQLSEDIRRHLSGMPVQARPDAVLYRTGKFLGRHRVATLAAIALLATAVGYLILTARYATRLAAERNQTARVAEFLVDLFDQSADSFQRGGEITARELLERGATKIDQGLTEQPAVRATLQNTIGRAYHNLGFYSRAVELHQAALQGRQSALDSDHEDIATALHDLAESQFRAGDLAGSSSSITAALELRRQLYGARHPTLADSLTYLAYVRMQQGQRAEAETAAREALAMRRQLLGEDHRDTAFSWRTLGRALVESGKLQEAEPAYVNAVSILRHRLGPHPELATALGFLGFVQLSTGRHDEAEAAVLEALEMRRQLLGERHPAFAESLSMLGFLRTEQGRFDDAQEAFGHNVEVSLERLGEDHMEVAAARFNLAKVLFQQGQFEAADELFELAVSRTISMLGDEHPRIAGLRAAQGANQLALGPIDQAEAQTRRAVEILQQVLGDRNPELAEAQMHLAVMWDLQGKSHAAEDLLRQSLARLRETYGSTHWRTAEAEVELGICLLRRGAQDEGRSLFEAGAATIRQQLGADSRLARRLRPYLVNHDLGPS